MLGCVGAWQRTATHLNFLRRYLHSTVNINDGLTAIDPEEFINSFTSIQSRGQTFESTILSVFFFAFRLLRYWLYCTPNADCPVVCQLSYKLHLAMRPHTHTPFVTQYSVPSRLGRPYFRRGPAALVWSPVVEHPWTGRSMAVAAAVPGVATLPVRHGRHGRQHGTSGTAEYVRYVRYVRGCVPGASPVRSRCVRLGVLVAAEVLPAAVGAPARGVLAIRPSQNRALPFERRRRRLCNMVSRGT